MKYFAILLSLVLMSSIGMAQNDVHIEPFHGHTQGTTWIGQPYADTDCDTSQAVALTGWAYCALRLAVADCLSMAVSYQGSNDGVTYSAVVLIDSISSANNSGDHMVFPLDADGMGFSHVKFVFEVTDFRTGISSDTMSLSIYKRR